MGFFIVVVFFCCFCGFFVVSLYTHTERERETNSVGFSIVRRRLGMCTSAPSRGVGMVKACTSLSGLFGCFQCHAPPEFKQEGGCAHRHRSLHLSRRYIEERAWVFCSPTSSICVLPLFWCDLFAPRTTPVCCACDRWRATRRSRCRSSSWPWTRRRRRPSRRRWTSSRAVAVRRFPGPAAAAATASPAPRDRYTSA